MDSYAVGEKVVLLCDIWDDGEDHHPPGYLAMKGETVVVRSVTNSGSVSGVSHEHITDNSFSVFDGEYAKL